MLRRSTSGTMLGLRILVPSQFWSTNNYWSPHIRSLAILLSSSGRTISRYVFFAPRSRGLQHLGCSRTGPSRKVSIGAGASQRGSSARESRKFFRVRDALRLRRKGRFLVMPNPIPIGRTTVPKVLVGEACFVCGVRGMRAARVGRGRGSSSITIGLSILYVRLS